MISGKEALIALANGEDLQQNVNGDWVDIRRDISWRAILGEAYKLRLKPRTTTINGVECGKLVSSQWSEDEPNKVKLEFHNEDDARYFQTKAIDIFNINKG